MKKLLLTLSLVSSLGLSNVFAANDLIEETINKSLENDLKQEISKTAQVKNMVASMINETKNGLAYAGNGLWNHKGKVITLAGLTALAYLNRDKIQDAYEHINAFGVQDFVANRFNAIKGWAYGVEPGFVGPKLATCKPAINFTKSSAQAMVQHIARERAKLCPPAPIINTCKPVIEFTKSSAQAAFQQMQERAKLCHPVANTCKPVISFTKSCAQAAYQQAQKLAATKPYAGNYLNRFNMWLLGR